MNLLPSYAVSTRLGQSGLHVLVIEDNEDDVELIRLALGDIDRQLEWSVAQDEPAVSDALARSPDMILCDYDLPALSPARVLTMLAERTLSIPLIVVTRAIGEDAVVQVLRQGARDYVAKDKLAMLTQVIERVLAQDATQQQARRMHAELQLAHERLRELSIRASQMQELERLRLARSLHDGLGQTLSGVHLLLEAAGREPDPDMANRHRREAHERLQDSIAAVKDLSFELRSPQLDVLGFTAAVRAAAARALGTTGLRFELRVTGDERWLAQTKAVVALAVIQEALTNTVRHAQAGQVIIRLRMWETGSLVVLCADDGRGFDVNAVWRAGDLRGRLGLTGMGERCELAGGQLRIRARVGSGTVVSVRL